MTKVSKVYRRFRLVPGESAEVLLRGPLGEVGRPALVSAGEGFAVFVDLVEIGLDGRQIRAGAVVVVRGVRGRDPHARVPPAGRAGG